MIVKVPLACLIVKSNIFMFKTFALFSVYHSVGIKKI